MSLCSFVFCVVALCLGVYAATTATLTLSGTITFEPYKMYVNSIKINSIDENGYVSNENLSGFNGLYLNDSSQLSTIDLGTQTVSQAGGLEIEIKFTSLDTTNYQKVTFSYTQPEGYEVSSTSTILKPNPQNMTQGDATGTFKIYISSETTTNLDISTLNLKIGFEDYGTSLLKYDTANDYYYVEMGTYALQQSSTNNYTSEYIRWRYLTSDLTGYARATDPTDTTNLSDLTGMYIQETYVDSSTHNVSWENSYIYESGGADPDNHHTETGLETVAANDYRASNIRKYLNLTNDLGENAYVSKSYSGSSGSSTGVQPSGIQSNLCNDLNIDPESDIIYQQISARDLTNEEGTGLYDNMRDQPRGGALTYDDSVGIPYPNGGSIDDNAGFDKFWLPSYYEMYNLFTNDEGNKTTSSCPSRVWHTQTGSAVSYYWLRSPYSSSYRANVVFSSSGSLDYDKFVYRTDSAARAAFQIL